MKVEKDDGGRKDLVYMLTREQMIDVIHSQQNEIQGLYDRIERQQKEMLELARIGGNTHGRYNR